jgi:lysophospholipase L1-like esterase
LLIGVNNQYQGRSIDEYRIQFTDLLNRAITYTGGLRTRVFVLSIPDYSVTPFARSSDTVRISREIDTFNIVNREISIQSGVTYINITPISREARTDALLTAVDGLHPSGKQYERWARLLAPAMKAAL